ncbi:BatA domain-containing protein [Haloplanus ruber]|uniref:BatA domain-containing protein n=1 Tax=Haloplanus ruber TaxID=869892 RepID=A0ABD6CX74_9EURY|nr:BatA domain-containing protein [Haloplanus ruber]
MALSDVFLTPLGLAALLAVVPVILLYLVQPDPRRVELPTIALLLDDEQRDASNPLLERLRRNLLLLLQLLVLVALAVALAGPYVSVSESQTVEETVIVLDGSASMTVDTGDGTRFAAARAAARETTTGTNSVVFAGTESRIALRSGGDTEVQATLDELTVTDVSADLGAAVSQAASIAGENARIVVFSDFADDGWTNAVRSARARDLQVDLRQFADGGANNVGIVDRSFSGRNVTLSVKNFGNATATRSVELGGRSRSVDLGPGDIERVTLTIPGGGGRAQLTPGDAFPADDVAYVAAPADPTVDVLLLTNDRDRYLTTALSVIEEVDLTVDEPPTTVEDEYDVILYSDLEPESLLRGNVEAGRNVIEAGGGVGILAQPSPPDTYGDLLLLSPNGTGQNPSVGRVTTTELTRGIDFPPPGTYLQGSLRAGTPLVQTTGGTPLVATQRRGAGRVLYYGYVGDDPFRFNYQYPVFWKRATFHLAGRESLASLNRGTGDRLQFGNETDVETPAGSVSARTVPLDTVGFYAVGDRRIGVSLYSEAESDVEAVPLADRTDDGEAVTREEERQVPQPLTWLVALSALLVIVGEVAFLRRRGDL